jgi:hypothetical protein
VDILLMVTGGYFINGHWWIFYFWLVVAILLMTIVEYFIIGYWWLFY